MAMKGTTVIELTNVKTGEQERYVEHNLITKALEYLYQPIPNLKMAVHGVQTSYLNYDAQSYEPAYSSLLGGIVLWDKNIDEQSEIITQPHGVKSVGCACYKQVNTTASPKRGSYNAAESHFENGNKERSMKFVYDFTTSQANGIIKCISLTSWQAGWNGFGGNDDIIDKAGSYMQYGDYHGTSLDTPYALYLSKQSNVFLIDPDEDVFYEVTSVTTGSVIIAKCQANLRQRSVFTNVYKDHPVIDAITVNLPVTMSTAATWGVRYDIDNHKLYIVVSSSTTIATNGTYYVISIDTDTYSAEVYTLQNSTGNTIYVNSSYLTCYDGYLYHAYYNNRYVNVVKIADGTCSKINIPNETGYPSNSGPRMYIANGMIYFRVYCTRNNSAYYAMAYIDPSDKTIHTMSPQYPPYYLYNYNNGSKVIPIKGYPLTYYTENYMYSSSKYYYWGGLWFNPNYLATINNLSRPIEKTSDKTMKITYTIQDM